MMNRIYPASSDKKKYNYRYGWFVFNVSDKRFLKMAMGFVDYLTSISVQFSCEYAPGYITVYIYARNEIYDRIRDFSWIDIL